MAETECAQITLVLGRNCGRFIGSFVFVISCLIRISCLQFRILAAGLSRNHARSLRPGAVLLTIVTMLGMIGAARADDVAVLSRTEPPGESRRRGTIVDYTGQALVLRLPSGREEQIASSRLLGYETELVPDHKNGNQLFDEGRFADAVVSYHRAISTDEQRRWVRRIILARMVQCYANLQQFVRAGDTFLLIVRSDPTTPLLEAIPLAWISTPTPGDLTQRATRWMKDADIPAARLMGASWLLATADRQAALQVLRELDRCEDSRIAMLAQAQLWRDRIVTASLADVQQWERELVRLDPSLRAGPDFLLGKSLARHGQSGAAALALMRIPVLHPDHHDLAAEALFAAGEQLEKIGDAMGAKTVYKELLGSYGQHRLVPAAKQRLERIAVH